MRCECGVCLQVRTRKMPLGTRLRSAWLARFASPACAAVMQPHPPCDKRRLAESAHADACAPFGFGFAESSLRFAPAHFSTIGRLPSGARPTPSSASRTAGSAYGGGISRPAHSVSAEFREALWRRTAGYRARIRRKARHPSATAARGAWSDYRPSRRAPAFAASAASRRLRLLRLVSPPPRHASRWKALMAVRESLPRQSCAKRKSGSQ